VIVVVITHSITQSTAKYTMTRGASVIIPMRRGQGRRGVQEGAIGESVAMTPSHHTDGWRMDVIAEGYWWAADPFT
jgi:hypothetical protein